MSNSNISIHTFYNTSVPDTSKQGTPRLDKTTKAPVLNRNNEMIMDYPRKKDEQGNTVYSNNIQIVFLASSTIPESLSASEVKRLSKSASKAERAFQCKPDTIYNIQWTSAEYEVLLENGDSAKVYKAQYNPMQPKFRPNLSW